METFLRPARREDFDFAHNLYVSLMKPLAEVLMPWRAARQAAVVSRALASGEARIIATREGDVGWLQVRETDSEVNLLQLYVAPSAQGRGIGTRLLRDLMAEARGKGKGVMLGVLRNNPARHFYAGLGFTTVSADRVKLYMRWPAP